MVQKESALKAEVIIDGETYLLEAEGFKITKVIANPVPVQDSDGDGIPDNVDPTPNGDGTFPTPQIDPKDAGTIKTGGWGADLTDKNAWKVVPMTGEKWKGLFKIVDKNGKNVITEFKTEDGAKAWLGYFQKNEFPPKPTVPVDPVPNPVPVGSKLDAQGVAMIYTPKANGQVILDKDTYQKESKHNTGPRSSVYGTVEYTANSGELTEIFTMVLSDDKEQNAPKLLSGGHTGSGDSDETRQGQCYAVGINQNGTLHLAKEVPYHNKTPKFYNKIQYVDKNWTTLGNIKGKKVFMKIIYYPIKKDNKDAMHIEWWFDVDALHTGKLTNNWKQMAFADDAGDWQGPPHLENMGVKFNGKKLGFYIRVDMVSKPLDVDIACQHELQLPALRVAA